MALSVVPPSLYEGLAQRQLQLAGHPVHCVDTGGQAPVLLLLHGSPISSFGFRHQIAALQERFRVIAPDLLTFGASGGPAQGASFALQAACLQELLTSTLALAEGAPLRLALHDWGGPIGLGALALCAQEGSTFTIEQLMLINTGFRPSFRPVWYWPFQYKALGLFLVMGLKVFDWGLPLLMRAAWNKDIRRPYRDALQKPGMRQSAARLEQLDGYQPLMELVQQSLPTAKEVLVFWGEPEPYFTPHDIAFAQECYPHAQVLRVPKAGHFPMEDDPTHLTNAMLAFFT